MTTEVQTIFNRQANRVARLFDHFESTDGVYSFNNPKNTALKKELERLKLNPYQSQDFKGNWIKFMDHIFADAKIRAEQYVDDYVKQLELVLTTPWQHHRTTAPRLRNILKEYPKAPLTFPRLQNVIHHWGYLRICHMLFSSLLKEHLFFYPPKVSQISKQNGD